MVARCKNTPANRKKIINALKKGASLEKAAKAGGVARSTLAEWRNADAKFEAEVCEAIEAGTDLIEDELLRRAVKGVEKPVGFHKGEHGGTYVTEYSDTLGMFILKARRPELYRENIKVENVGDTNLEGARDSLARKFIKTTTGKEA